MESNKNSCVEEEIPEQPGQSTAHRSAKRDHVRHRRSCETEQQSVARRVADRSPAKRRRTAETYQQTEVQRAAHRSRTFAGSATSLLDDAAVTPREPKSRERDFGLYKIT